MQHQVLKRRFQEFIKTEAIKDDEIIRKKSIKSGTSFHVDSG